MKAPTPNPRLGCAVALTIALAVGIPTATIPENGTAFAGFLLGVGWASIPMSLDGSVRAWWGDGPGKRPPAWLWKEDRVTASNTRQADWPRLQRGFARARVLIGVLNALFWLLAGLALWGVGEAVVQPALWLAFFVGGVAFLTVAAFGRPRFLLVAVDRYRLKHPESSPDNARSSEKRHGTGGHLKHEQLVCGPLDRRPPDED